MHFQNRLERFRGEYGIETGRLKGWDYGSSGYYFVTICVKDRECVFGNVDDYKMVLSESGEIAEKFWLEIPAHFPFVKLDEFIIMPNHIHRIIIIDNHRGVGRGRDVGGERDVGRDRDGGGDRDRDVGRGRDVGGGRAETEMLVGVETLVGVIETLHATSLRERIIK